MTRCITCQINGFCPKIRSPRVTDAELYDPSFIRAVREFAHNLQISPTQWLDHLTDMYRDYRGTIVNEHGRRIDLDMEVFEIDSIREWFRDFVRPMPAFTTPRIRGESRERLRILATILRTTFPREFTALLAQIRSNEARHPPYAARLASPSTAR